MAIDGQDPASVTGSDQQVAVTSNQKIEGQLVIGTVEGLNQILPVNPVNFELLTLLGACDFSGYFPRSFPGSDLGLVASWE